MIQHPEQAGDLTALSLGDLAWLLETGAGADTPARERLIAAGYGSG